MSRRPPPQEPRPGMWLFVLAFFFSPIVLLAWACGQAVLRRTGWRGWRLGVPALAGGVLVVVAEGGPLPALLLHFSGYIGLLMQFGQPVIHLPMPGAFLVPQIPLAVPMGLVAASVTRRSTGLVAPEFEQAEQRRRARAEQRTRRRAERLAEREASRPESAALGVSLGGDGVWRQGRLVVPPPGQFGLTNLMLGGPGTGKSTTAERIAYLTAREHRHLTVIDGKGTDGLDEAITAAYLAGWPDATVAAFPQRPVDLWQATPQQLVNRFVCCWSFSSEAEFYEQAATLGLRLALTAPGPPCASSAELVTRLDPAWLERAWQGHAGSLSLIRGPMKARLGDVALRMSNLAAALGPGFDGDWWLPGVDLACFTVPTLENPKDGDAAMRVLVAAYAQWITRRTRRRPSQLLFDEFGAVEGGRRQAINLVERARSAGAGVLLSAQSAVGLGDETERARLLAAASAVILFRSPQPAELAALAGSERVAEAAWQVEDGDLTGRQTITMRARGRVDQDAVRGAPTGVAHIIAAGRVERARIIRTAIAPDVHDHAAELVAGEHPVLPATAPPPALPESAPPEESPA